MIEVRNRQRRRVNLARIRQLASRLHKSDTLSIVLVNDRQISELNLRYHNTPGATDILTFDYGEGAAELIISVDQAYSQARRYHTTTAKELALGCIDAPDEACRQSEARIEQHALVVVEAAMPLRKMRCRRDEDGMGAPIKIDQGRNGAVELPGGKRPRRDGVLEC